MSLPEFSTWHQEQALRAKFPIGTRVRVIYDSHFKGRETTVRGYTRDGLLEIDRLDWATVGRPKAFEVIQ